MPWVLGRESLPALAPDPEWRGRPGSTLPTADWWSVNTPAGAAWADGAIDVRVVWLDTAGRPVVVDADAVTIESAFRDDLVFPGLEQKTDTRICMGEIKNTKAWRAEPLLIPPRGLVSVRVTGAIAAGADRAAVQFWRAA